MRVSATLSKQYSVWIIKLSDVYGYLTRKVNFITNIILWCEREELQYNTIIIVR